MLINLRTIHKPATLDEAVHLLQQPDTRALYGGAFVRENAKEVTDAVDLSALGLSRITRDGNTLIIGSTATLETVRQYCLTIDSVIARALADVLREEAPLSLRNVLTPGDVISEARGNSLLLTLFAVLGARSSITRRGGVLIEARRVTLDSPTENCGYAFEKIARTPADAPIVGAVAWAEAGESRVAICGLLQMPTLYTFGMPAQISDYLGGTEYRTEMAKVLARRTLTRAEVMAGQIG